MNDAQTVDRFGLLVACLDAVVESNHIGAWAELLGADRFQEGQAHALLRRCGARIDVENRKPGILLQELSERPVLGGDEQSAIVQMLQDNAPIQVRLSKQ